MEAEEHRPQLASTNPLERLNKAIKRRSRVIGFFPNNAAIVHLVGPCLAVQPDEWQGTRGYMSQQSLARAIRPDESQPPALLEEQQAAREDSAGGPDLHHLTRHKPCSGFCVGWICLVTLRHLLIARICAARCSKTSASAVRFVARYKPARFSRLVATLGWLGPSAFSEIDSARL